MTVADFVLYFSLVYVHLGLVCNLAILLTRRIPKYGPTIATAIRRYGPLAIALARPGVPLTTERVIEEARNRLDPNDPLRELTEELDAQLGAIK